MARGMTTESPIDQATRQAGQPVKNHFGVKELVSPEIYEDLGDASLRLIPSIVMDRLNALREALGAPIMVNNWESGGMYRYSGIRPTTCPEGASRSRHKLTVPGVTAFDLKCSRLSKLVTLVRSRSREFGIVRIENPNATKTWLHVEFCDSADVGELIAFDQ